MRWEYRDKQGRGMGLHPNAAGWLHSKRHGCDPTCSGWGSMMSRAYHEIRIGGEARRGRGGASTRYLCLFDSTSFNLGPRRRAMMAPPASPPRWPLHQRDVILCSMLPILHKIRALYTLVRAVAFACAQNPFQHAMFTALQLCFQSSYQLSILGLANPYTKFNNRVCHSCFST